MARKKKDQDAKLTDQFKVWMTVSDAAAFREKVARSQMPLSRFVREAVLTNQTEVVVTDPSNFVAIAQVCRLGNNLNQIARRLNEAHKAGAISKTDLSLALADLVSLRQDASRLVRVGS